MKCNSIFEQRPNDHLSGYGCPYCNESKGEKLVENILKEKNIFYEKQKRFKECRNKLPLPFDFYLPEKNICIEYDGEQHFMSKSKFGGEKGLKKTQKRDEIKNDFCKKENIQLIRFKYNQYIEEIRSIIFNI